MSKLKDQIAKITSHKFFMVTFVSLVVFIIIGGGALAYLTYQEKETYPQVNAAKFQELENALLEAVGFYKNDTTKAIKVLESFGRMPELLENRKNFVLAGLYNQIGETALAFIKAYEIGRDYLPKYSSYRRAKIAEKIGLEGTVVKELDFLSHQFPKEAKYHYELGKSYSRQSRFEDAKKTFDSVQTMFPESEYALGSDYYLAGIAADKEEKSERLLNYLTKSPDGSLATLISGQIMKMPKTEQAQYSKYTNYFGLSYYHQEDYKNAIKYFNVNFDKPDLYLKAYAETLVKLKRKGEAINLLKIKLPMVEDKKIAADILEYNLSILSRYGAIAQLKLYKDQMPKIKDKILWELAKRTKAKKDYIAVFKNYPDSFYAAESMARVFWKEYRHSNYRKAIELAKRHWEKYPYANSHPFVAYWAAKIHLKLAPKAEPPETEEPIEAEEEKIVENPEYSIDQAHEILHNLIISHPRGYYSFRAQQVLDKDKSWYKLPGPNEFLSFPTWDWPLVYKDDELTNLYGEDILELTKIKQFRFILDLVDTGDLKVDKDFKMWLYAGAGENLKAISTAYFSLPKNKEINFKNLKFQYAFPLAFADLVADEISANLKVDPMLAHALIKQESRYQVDIVSKVGAIGLMQLMPYTARSVARSIKMRPPRVRDLYKPELNIKLGVKYMETVFDRFENNMIHAIASYNAGPVAVKNWKNKFGNIEPDEFIERIPYAETKGYVKKVLNNYWIYKKLYG